MDVRIPGRVITVFSGTAMSSATSAASDIIDVTDGGYFGLWYKITPTSGASGIRIWYEQSYNTSAACFVIPDGAADVVTYMTDPNIHVKSIAPAPMQYLVFGASAVSAVVPSDAKLTMVMFMQGD